MNAIFLRKFFECNTIFQVFFHYCQFGFSCDEHKSTPINCNLSVQIMGVTSCALAEMVGQIFYIMLISITLSKTLYLRASPDF